MTRFIPGPDTTHDFRGALGRFATGVTVVTCQSERGPLGMTANSFASVSLDPPLVLWSPAKSSSRHLSFINAGHFCIHVLGQEQRDLCMRFVKDGLDFKDLSTTETPNGAPLIKGCLAHFECSLSATHDAGDHTIIVGHVDAASARDGEPLVYSSGGFGRFNA